ncbi:MAG: ATP-binding cassette domain-containing protein [Chloroflexi bacterium]|nr:ATP-binding cassette domain-containing protein [Chloroflexota bacterium]
MTPFARSARPARAPHLPAAESAGALVIGGLAHRYALPGGALLALDGVELLVRPGEFVSLVGPSGCGKSTLLRLAAGLLRPQQGSVQALGVPPTTAAAAHAIGLVTQQPGLLPWRSVAANVALPLQLSGARRESAARVGELLARVGMSGFASAYPQQLSGGMLQRVTLARALAHRPRLLLMDEPFGALDELAREELRRELLRLWEREHVSVLFVTHAVREAVLLSDRVVVLSARPGRVVADIAIDLPRPRDDTLEATPAFAQLAAAVRAALASNADRMEAAS